MPVVPLFNAAHAFRALEEYASSVNLIGIHQTYQILDPQATSTEFFDANAPSVISLYVKGDMSAADNVKFRSSGGSFDARVSSGTLSVELLNGPVSIGGTVRYTGQYTRFVVTVANMLGPTATDSAKQRDQWGVQIRRLSGGTTILMQTTGLIYAGEYYAFPLLAISRRPFDLGASAHFSIMARPGGGEQMDVITWSMVKAVTDAFAENIPQIIASNRTLDPGGPFVGLSTEFGDSEDGFFATGEHFDAALGQPGFDGVEWPNDPLSKVDAGSREILRKYRNFTGTWNPPATYQPLQMDFASAIDNISADTEYVVGFGSGAFIGSGASRNLPTCPSGSVTVGPPSYTTLFLNGMDMRVGVPAAENHKLYAINQRTGMSLHIDGCDSAIDFLYVPGTAASGGAAWVGWDSTTFGGRSIIESASYYWATASIPIDWTTTDDYTIVYRP